MILISFLFIGLCICVIYFDLKFMRIPDLISVGFLVLFVVSVFVQWPDIGVLARLLTGVTVFVICFALFALNIMGGGDTKVIPAMALFVPLTHLSGVLLLFALCLLGSILILLVLRSFTKQHTSTWAGLSSNKLPMGVAIGVTGLIAQLAAHV